MDGAQQQNGQKKTYKKRLNEWAYYWNIVQERKRKREREKGKFVSVHGNN